MRVAIVEVAFVRVAVVSMVAAVVDKMFVCLFARFC